MEGMKEMFYLTTHSTHFIYGYIIKDHSDSERGNPLPPHWLLFPISSKGSFICTIPDRIAHTTAFATTVVDHWLEREIAQWLHHEGSIRRPIAPWANALTTELHLAPLYQMRHTPSFVLNQIIKCKIVEKLFVWNIVLLNIAKRFLSSYFWIGSCVYELWFSKRSVFFDITK